MSDLLTNLQSFANNFSPELYMLALMSGVTVFLLFYGIAVPFRGKPKSMTATTSLPQLAGIQSKLDEAQIDISAKEYVILSLKTAIPLGLGLYILIGAFTLGILGVGAGFLFTWTKLEQDRDKKNILYSKQLASVCDTLRTAYGVNPSLKKAMEAAAEYSQSPLKEDFQEILIGITQDRMVESLQEIADRRRSIVFDTVATSLIRAADATGEVGDMLMRLADSTRENVSAFEDAISSQINARSNIQWGTYGPWLIFAIFKGMTLFMGMGANANVFAGMAGFFSTSVGNVVAAIAAMITILVYRHCIKLSQRGLVVKRVSTSESTANQGPKNMPTSAQSAPKASILSGQGRTVDMKS